MADRDDGVLVCALQGAAHVVPGSSMDRVCSTCQSPVMIAPSGQNFLAKFPRTKIVCQNCCPPGENAILPGKPVPGALEEAIEFWRKRGEDG